METAIIVPARLESTRLPRKLLAEVAGKPILLWTAERIREVAPEWPLFFAVDAPELAGILEENGFNAILTSPHCASGTDRLAEANRRVDARFILNVQADEPLVQRQHIQLLDDWIHRDGVSFATLATPIESEDAWNNPNIVKVVLRNDGRALYFSRSPIPRYRDQAPFSVSPANRGGPVPLRHMGLYAYTAQFLESFSSLPSTPLEEAEKLEQLRALEHGYPVHVGVSVPTGAGIDTAEDLAAFSELVANTLRR